LDGNYTYYPESFILPTFCNGKDVLTQERPPDGSNFTVIQNGVKVDYGNFTANEPIQFISSKDMGTLSGKSYDLEVVITRNSGENTETVLNKEIHSSSKPCQWLATAEWNFTPQEGKYRMGVITKEDGIVTGTSDTGFTVKSDTPYANQMSPLKQFKSGISAQDVTCAKGLHLMIKAEDGLPVCIETKDATSLFERGWTKQIHYYIDKQVSHDVYSYMQPKSTLPDYSYDGIDKDGMVTINNGTYYQTTFNYTVDNLPKNVQVKFQNVTFTFPEGILNTPGGSFVPLDVKFTDSFEEIYGGIIKFSDNVTGNSGISIPTMYGPAIARNSVTVIGNHMMPQAGLTIYNDKIMLLVSK
ncbi:MAG: hypothetical protein ACREBJ_11525, partial [Nitrosotalea sp.]